MATEGQEPNPSEMDESVAPEAFSMVWVKMEVEEEGTVQGLDGDAADDDGDYPEYGQMHKYLDTSLGQNSGAGDEEQSFQVNFSENLRKGPAKRCRKKASAPNRRAPVDPELKRFSCQYCDYKAMHKNALKYHIMKHTNEPPMACKFCNYTTRYPTSMKQHVLGQHTDKDDPALLAMPVYKCNLCEYSSRFKWNLAVHRRKHAAEKSFQCDLCGFASAHRHSFIKHVKRHGPKENTMYQCDKCPFKTKYEGHISRHLAVIHKEVSEKATTCDHCEFSTRVRWRMNQHKKNSRQENPIVCGLCDFVTEYYCEAKLHKRKHAFDRNAPREDQSVHMKIKLPMVKNSEIIQNNLNASTENINAVPTQIPHSSLSINTEYPPNASNEVPQQSESFKNNILINPTNTPDDKFYILDKSNEEIDWRKIEVVEVPGVEKTFHCKECDYNAKYKASVQRHFQRLHTGKDVRPYKCLMCGFTTKTKDQISLHVKRSKSETLLNCNLCAFLSYFKCQNVIHQKKHYPLKCTLCDYVCKQNYTMQEHFRIVHLGQSLQCKYCDYIASGKSNLLTHQVKHTCDQFTCELCDYKTVRRRLLQVHVKKNHPNGRIEPKIIDDKKIASLKTDEVDINQQTLENLVKNMQEQIKKFSNKLANDEKNTNVEKITEDGSLKNDEAAGPKIESVSIKMERDIQNKSHSVIQPVEDFNQPQNNVIQPQAAVVHPTSEANFQMRYAESLSQTYYENAIRYASTHNQNVFERW